MKNTLPVWLLAATTLLTPALAQTSSLCDPTKRDGCPADPALASSRSYDFTKGPSSDFKVEGQAPTYDANGANFLSTAANTATTLVSNWYMMFGYVEVTLKAAKGRGIVSAVALLSDDLDEIDWEMVGPDGQNAQTNYFGKGCACGYGRGTTISATNCQQQWHTYKIEWKADQITWWVDDNKAAARVLTQAQAAKGQWPQTPMQLKIGIWASLDKNDWSGGPATFKDGPNQMQVKSVKAIDYSTGKSYSYGDKSGSWQSIKSDGGAINPKGNSNVAQPSSSSSSTSVSTSGTATYSASSSVSTSASTSTSGTSSGSTSATDSSSTTCTTTSSGSATSSDSSSTSATDSSSVLSTDSSSTSATETSVSASPTCTILTITSDSSVYTITSSYTQYSNSSTSATGDSTDSATATDSGTATDSSATATETGLSTVTTDSATATDSSSSSDSSSSDTASATSSSTASPSAPIQPGAGVALKAQGVFVAIAAVVVGALVI